MDNLICLDIVSQVKMVYCNKASIINLRGINGEMGISYGHSQLLSIIPPGVIQVTHEKGKDTLFISGGVIEIQPKKVVILADLVERAQDLDLKEINKLKQGAKKLLNESVNLNKVDIMEAKKILLESEARLRAAKLLKGLTASYSD